MTTIIVSSYLDGIPVRISPKVLPPRSVIIPTAIDTTLSADLFLDQYDFSLERSVLESIQNRQVDLQAAKLKCEGKNSESASGKNSEKDDKTRTSSAQNVIPWESNSILLPKLQQSASEKVHNSPKVKSKNAKINLSDFENDMSSPFDYMELQTINDLEELSNVFQGFQTSDPSSTDQTAQETETSDDAEKSLPSNDDNPPRAEVGNGVAKSVSFPLPQNAWQPIPHKPISNSLSEDSVGSGLKVTRSFDDERPTTLLSSSGAAPPHRLVARDFVCDAINYPSLSQVPYISSSAWGNADKATSLRGSKSYTDITSISESDDLSVRVRERSRTPPSFSSDSSGKMDEPLPIKEDHFGISSSNNNGMITYGEESAYEELEEEAKHFVDSLTEMGFAKGQVSRAVKHLGTDEKKVVEHLCQIQALEESGYESSEAEAALHLHDYNRDQAKEFLDLVNQFQDLGFEKDAVKKALVQNKNDWNKTIDALLPSS